MTRVWQAVSMKDGRVLETEVLVPRPKRFVRDLVEMPDGYPGDALAEAMPQAHRELAAAR
jgi:hypothetical protein